MVIWACPNAGPSRPGASAKGRAGAGFRPVFQTGPALPRRPSHPSRERWKLES